MNTDETIDRSIDRLMATVGANSSGGGRDAEGAGPPREAAWGSPRLRVLVVATWVPAAPPTGRHGPWHGMHGGYRLQATGYACWGLAQAVAASYRGAEAACAGRSYMGACSPSHRQAWAMAWHAWRLQATGYTCWGLAQAVAASYRGAVCWTACRIGGCV